MSDTRTTIYLKPKVYRALKDKAAITDRSVSELVNAAVLESLREDILDLEALDSRVKEQTRPFVNVLKEIM
ncbi:CopG family transcriptional regulator [Nitrospira sp. CMX1]